MASLLESKKVFESRLANLGLQSFVNALNADGVDTLGDMSFATAWQPGSADDADFLKFAKRILGELPESLGEGSSGEARAARVTEIALYNRHSNRLRRLFVESYTIYTANLKLSVTNPQSAEGQAPRKLVIEERNERMKQLRELLQPGLEILADELEPSHLLTDKLVDMKERNEMILVDWSELTT